MVKDIICLIQGRNLFDSNQYSFDPKIFCLNKKNFVSLKQNISLHQRKCFIGRYTLYHSLSCPKFQLPIKSLDVTIFEKQC